MRRLAPWALIWGLTLALTALSSDQSLRRYREFRSGWSWDLAYNNQCYWALLSGDQTLSIRPINAWGDEGPSIWVSTHLDPIRLLLVPFYALWPGPETLIVAQNVMLWWVVPAAFGLVRSESGSTALGLSGAALVPLTPLLWPLLWNDFRETELAMPFILWAIQGFRLRHKGLAALGCAGLLLCREEFAVLIASLALLPPKHSEDVGTTYTWARAAVYLGAGWMLFAFFGYQYLMVSGTAPEGYLKQFGGAKPGVLPTARVALELLTLGVGPWLALAVLAPRVAVLALPWVWGVANGRWRLELLADWRWHHVRYAAPAVAMVLAAGLVGYARLGTRAMRRRHGAWALAGLWLAVALGLAAAGREIQTRMDRIPRPISREEAATIWGWIGRVKPEDAVLASYEVSAPLSSRRLLYSHQMTINEPRGYPRLGPEFRWVFLRKHALDPGLLTGQGFRVVHRGDFLAIYHRGEDGRAAP